MRKTLLLQLCSFIRELGFRESYREYDPYVKTESVIFFREAEFRGCFEQVFILPSGPMCYIDAGVGVLPGRSGNRALYAGDRIAECGNPIKTKKDVNALLDALVDLSEHRFKSITNSIAPSLLAKVQLGRLSAGYYLQFFQGNRRDRLKEYWDSLKAMATLEQREKAKYALRTWMISIPSRNQDDEDRAFHAYQVAAYLMALHEDEGRCANMVLLGDSEADLNLVACIQLMSCVIYREPGYELLTFS